MRETAKKYGVCTQMGNQGTASSGMRRGVEFLQDGGLGKVKEVHVWTNRPIWPQAPKVMKKPEGKFEIPKHVHWDEFIGPAPLRPYAPGYHPFAWRGWLDFGTGALGDMGCHTANLAFMGLKLGSPTSVKAEAGDVNPETYPSWAHVTLEFPARGDMSPVTFNWYEGRKDGKLVHPPQELQDKVIPVSKRKELVASGSIIVGEKGILYSPDDYGADWYVWSENPDAFEKLNRNKPERLKVNNQGDQGQKNEWVEAIKAGKHELAFSNFDYASMLTEAILLGNVAILSGEKLTYDGATGTCVNNSKANSLIKTQYRKGWELIVEA
jgi:predicted dehydrogenase